jgi:hypothetical protein
MHNLQEIMPVSNKLRHYFSNYSLDAILQILHSLYRQRQPYWDKVGERSNLWKLEN